MASRRGLHAWGLVLATIGGGCGRRADAPGQDAATTEAGAGDLDPSDAAASPDASPEVADPDERTDASECGGQRVDAGCLVTVAGGNVQPYNIAVTATHVYWTTTFVPPPGHGKVMRAALGGGAPEELAPGAAGNNPHAIAVDDTSVYWTDFTPTTGAIMKMPLGGGPPTAVVTLQDTPHGLAVDATSVYWTTYLGQGQVRRALKTPPDGGLSPVIDLAVAEDSPNNVAVDATFVYWTNSIPSRGAVRKAAIDGSAPPTTIASMQETPYGITVDATHVYWTNSTGGQVMKMPLDGGPPVTLASGQTDPYVIAVDATNVYWANYRIGVPNALGAIRRAPLTGGPWTELAPATSYDVVVDDTSVYWTSYLDGVDGEVSVEGGSVFRLTPK